VSPFGLLAFDAATLGTAVLASELTEPGRVGRSLPVWVVSFTVLVLTVLFLRGAYRHRLQVHVLDEVRAVATTTALAAMTLLAIRVLLTDDPSAAGQTARQWLFATAALAATHALLGAAEIRARKRGDVGRPTLIVGAGKIGQLVARRLSQYPELGLQPVGFLDEAPLEGNGETPLVPVLGGTSDLEDAIGRLGIEHVVVTFSMASHEVLLDVVRRCEQLGVNVSLVPRLFEKMKEKVRVDCVGSLPLLTVDPTDPKGWQFAVKYSLDRIVAAVLLLLSAPLLVTVALAVWVSSGRPILFRQLRVGRDGRAFVMLKFRSMRPLEDGVASLLDLPEDTAPGGPEAANRKTGFGALLRRTSLDELPQLINVLRGEMSLVGPRPERPEFVKIFQQDVHRYADRHRVKAGITGWAQINGLRGNTSLSDRAEWDNYYIDNWSLWLDIKILASTASALVRFPAD
jgi:exopolysaccharide biosynthesis polyprenyl glycosylphosphotransferase